MAASISSSIKKAQIPSACQLCEVSRIIHWKCLDCELLLCENCKVNIHPKIKSADNHDVISLKDVGKEQKAKRHAPNIKCKIHQSLFVCLYCMKCKVVACPNCVSENHIEHHLESIIKIHDKYVGKLTYINDELKADLNVYIDNEKKKTETYATDKQTYETSKSTIERHVEEIKRVVDEEGDKVLTHLEKNWTAIENAYDTESSTILCAQVDIRSKITTSEKSLDKNDTVGNIECEQKMSSDWEHREMLDKSASEIKLLKYFPERVDEQILKKMIGSLQPCIEPGIKFDILRSQTTDMGNITNLYACRDGHAYICDEYCTYSMKKMAFHESELKDTQHFRDLRVFDLTETNRQEFIVSFVDKTCLKLIKPCGTMENYMDFSPWQPRALHFTQSGKLLVSGREQGNLFPIGKNSDRKIVVLDSNGKGLYHFEFDNEGNRLFSLVYRIQTLKNNDIVIIDSYISNFQGRVISIRYPNTTNWIYKGGSEAKSTNPFKPTSIATTEAGNIIVNDRDNHQLHVLDVNGSLIRLIKTKDNGITMRPESFALNSKNHHLWISCLNKENKRNAMLYIVKFSGF